MVKSCKELLVSVDYHVSKEVLAGPTTNMDPSVLKGRQTLISELLVRVLDDHIGPYWPRSHSQRVPRECAHEMLAWLPTSFFVQALQRGRGSFPLYSAKVWQRRISSLATARMAFYVNLPAHLIGYFTMQQSSGPPAIEPLAFLATHVL